MQATVGISFVRRCCYDYFVGLTGETFCEEEELYWVDVHKLGFFSCGIATQHGSWPPHS